MTVPALPATPLDVAVGATARTVAVAAGVTRRASRLLRPLARTALRPPLVPERLRPERWVGELGLEGADRRVALRDELVRLLDVLVPTVLEEVLRRAHLTDLVLRHLDVDRVVAAVDLDDAAERLDLDAVARRLDLDAVIERLDLTAIVLERVDLEVLIEACLDRIDLVGLAGEVIDGVDLPEIIRESTGSMASDTVRGVRMQGIVADEAIGRAVDRMLLRRGRGHGGEPTVPTQPGRG